MSDRPTITCRQSVGSIKCQKQLSFGGGEEENKNENNKLHLSSPTTYIAHYAPCPSVVCVQRVKSIISHYTVPAAVVNTSYVKYYALGTFYFLFRSPRDNDYRSFSWRYAPMYDTVIFQLYPVRIGYARLFGD